MLDEELLEKLDEDEDEDEAPCSIPQSTDIDEGALVGTHSKVT